MLQLKDYIRVDHRFQKSINLQLDLENKERLDSYIPTRSSIEILKIFLQGVLGNSSNRATILIGPYGKGKSHLLLILLAILRAKKGQNFCKEKIVAKIGETDSVAKECIKKVVQKEMPLLPILISATRGDLKQAFLLGLKEGLEREGIESIVPKSYYSEAEIKILDWKKNYIKTYKAFEQLLEKEHKTVSEVQKGLASYKEEYLTKFCELYPYLTSGSIFQPMVQTELIPLFKEITHTLCKEYGYGGIYIIFDEFSKYIEGHGIEYFASDMKLIQDLCELANYSTQEQIHFTLIAHKSIKEYGNCIPKEVIDSFRGVEGRLKEVLFVVSSQNNYDLMKDAIKKDLNVVKNEVKKKELFRKVIEESYAIPCFQSAFQKKDFFETIGYGCFPLTPIAAYLLLHISEKVAQNERTIFTFLSGKDPYSFQAFLNKGLSELMGVAQIYDYFKGLFKEDNTNVFIHNEWLKADYALSKADTNEEKEVIKALALIHMINKDEELLAQEKVISLALGIGYERCFDVIQGLKEKQILLWRSKNRTLTFKNNVGVDVEKEIQAVIKNKCNKISICNILAEITELEYVLPKKYNQIFSMTRYFQYEFILASQFLNLKTGSYLFEGKYADGKILALVMDKELTPMDIEEQVKSWGDERILVVVPRKAFKQVPLLKRLKAIEWLESDAKFLENNMVLEQELKLYTADLIYEINEELYADYFPENKQCDVYTMSHVYHDFSNHMEWNRLLSRICGNYYKMAPKINHELVNRHFVTPQIKKARNKVIEDILKEVNCEKYYDGTSPEATIFRAVLVQTGICKGSAFLDVGIASVIKEVDLFITLCEGKKVCFSQLYQILQGKDYGVRRGIVPILLASRFVLLHDMPVIYLGNQELEISANILNNVNDKPFDYFLYIEKETLQKEKYLKNLEALFIGDEIIRGAFSKGNRLVLLVEEMQKWYRSLPQYTTIFTLKEEEKSGFVFYSVMLGIRYLLRKVEVNPRELLFEKIPHLFLEHQKECNEFEYYYQGIQEVKLFLNRRMGTLKEEVLKKTKIIFRGSQQDNLNQCLKSWYQGQSQKAKSYLYNTKVSSLMNYIQGLDTHDEEEMLSRISKMVIDLYIEDWNDESFVSYMEELQRVKEEIEGIADTNFDFKGQNFIRFKKSNGEEIEKYFQNQESEGASYFFKNAVEDVLEEFGESLEMNQKVAVLMQMVEQLLK